MGIGTARLAVVVLACIVAAGGFGAAIGQALDGGEPARALEPIELRKDDATDDELVADDARENRDGDGDLTWGDDGTMGGNNTGDGDRTRGDDGTRGGNNTGDGDRTRGNDGTRKGDNTGDRDRTRGNDGTRGGNNTGDGDWTAGNDGTAGGDNSYVAPAPAPSGGGGGGDSADGGTT